MKKKSKITLDGLAKQVQRGFTLMGKRFDGLEHRLNRYATATAEDISELGGKIDAVDRKVTKLDEDVNNGFSEINLKLDRHDTRISGVEGVVIHPSRTKIH